MYIIMKFVIGVLGVIFILYINSIVFVICIYSINKFMIY